MTSPTVTLYGRPTCHTCLRTKKLLLAAGVDLLYVDVDEDPDALDGLTELEWVTALPVVITPDPQLQWCGYRPELIKALIHTSGTS